MAMPRRPPRHHNLNSSAGLSTAASALILSADRPFAGGRPNWPPLEARSFAPHLPRTAAGRTPEFRAQGLFVGSGVIEAGCKTVIGTRLKQSGMEWSVRGANAITSLRCIFVSGRFEDYWESRVA